MLETYILYRVKVCKKKQGPQGPQKLSSQKSLKIQTPTDTGNLHSYIHQKWLPYQIPGIKAVKNVQIDPHQRRYRRKTKPPWVSDGESL